MNDKPFFDFIIEEDEYYTIIFRFYTKNSHVHGFHDECPKSWEKVYKVYYSWQIILLDDDGETVLLSLGWDECSEFVNLDAYLEHILKKKPKFYRITSFGQPASDWEIKYRKYHDWETGKRVPKKDNLEISVWNNFSNQGYRFNLDIEKTKSFISYIKEVNSYMLEHSEPC